MNQIVAPKLQSDSKYPSVLRTSVCDRAGKRHNISCCYYTHYTANKHARKFVTPKKVADGSVRVVTPSNTVGTLQIFMMAGRQQRFIVFVFADNIRCNRPQCVHKTVKCVGKALFFHLNAISADNFRASVLLRFYEAFKRKSKVSSFGLPPLSLVSGLHLY